jgi:hypothetical protein
MNRDTDTFFAVWGEWRRRCLSEREQGWLGLTDEGDDQSPFLFETRTAAIDWAKGYGLLRYVIVTCSLTRPELPPPPPPKPRKPRKPRNYADLRPPSRRKA